MTTENKGLTFLERLTKQLDADANSEALKQRIAAHASKDMADTIRKQEDGITLLNGQLSTLDSEITVLMSDLQIARCPAIGQDGKPTYSAMKLVQLKDQIDAKTGQAKKLNKRIVAADAGLSWLKSEADAAFTDLDVQDVGALRDKYSS